MTVAQLFEDRDRQRGALDRVGAGAQLVYQAERAGVGKLHDADNIRHVRREGGQRLLNALLVADVHQHAAKNTQLAVVGAGHQQAAHRHQREQAERFEGDGLAAGVGTRDDKGVKFSAEVDVDRHHLVLGDQRMPRLLEVDDAAVIDNRHGRAHGIGEVGLGKDEVELREALIAADDRVRKVTGVGGQFEENALDLFLLLVFEHANIIVRLHHAHRLDKDRLTAGGGVVYQTGHVVAALGANGHHISAVALGDDGVLQILYVFAAVDDFVEHLARLGRRGADLAPDVGERGARLVGDLVLAENGGGDLVLQIFVGDQSAEIRIEGGFH